MSKCVWSWSVVVALHLLRLIILPCCLLRLFQASVAYSRAIRSDTMWSHRPTDRHWKPICGKEALPTYLNTTPPPICSSLSETLCLAFTRLRFVWSSRVKEIVAPSHLCAYQWDSFCPNDHTHYFASPIEHGRMNGRSVGRRCLSGRDVYRNEYLAIDIFQ